MNRPFSLKILPKDFGKSWASKNAIDLMRIAVAFGGFDIKELIK